MIFVAPAVLRLIGPREQRVRIVVISLADAAERRASMRRQFERAGVGFEFLDAVRGDQDFARHFADYDARRYRLHCRREASPGEVGCYASHLRLWTQCAAGSEPYVILEDDARLEPGFPQALALLEKLLPRHGFVRLEGLTRPRRLARLRDRPALYPVAEHGRFHLAYVSDVPLCTMAYAVSPTAAAALARHSARLSSPVDKFLQRTWEHGVPVFGLSPSVVVPATQITGSTIGPRPAKSWHPALLLRRLAWKTGARLRRRRFDQAQLRRLGIPLYAASADRQSTARHRGETSTAPGLGATSNPR